VNGDIAALLLIFGVHLIALAIIVGPLARSAVRERDDADGGGPSDDDGGGGSKRPSIGPTRPRPRGDLPLPDAAPARVRLRGPGLLADQYSFARRGEPRPVPGRRIRR
jgi:hypothetical protein